MLSFNVTLSVAAVAAIVLMANYLAARHFMRFTLAQSTQAQLSPFTKRVLDSVTNELKIIVYFNRDEPLFDSVQAILKEYRFANDRVSIQYVDYMRDPGTAAIIKSQYKLTQLTDKDLVIFDSNGRTKFVYQQELSEVDIQPLVSGESREVKRTHFKGELMFTSAIYSVTSLRPLKAYFLQGGNAHQPDSDDADVGYSKFATVLEQNNIKWATLSLVGTNDVPADCNLLIIAGVTDPLLEGSGGELVKIDQYLKNGGRSFILFNYFAVNRRTGLERILADWGVEVGDNLVRDLPNSSTGQDLIVSRFGTHPIVKPLYNTKLHLIMPRSERKSPRAGAAADAPNISEILFTGPQGTIITDIRSGVPYPGPEDVRTSVCLAVAVEKGKLRDVSADRGTTRLVVVGESIFLGNKMIESAANRDFAALSLNWLLDRTQLLSELAPRPIKEYKTVMTKAQMTTVRWVMLLGMPGTVLALGALVWLRRRS